MSRVVLQIPMEKSLRTEAERVAISQGFSSLQEVIRIFLRRLSDKKVKIIFEDEVLSERTSKLFAKIDEDIKKGKNLSPTFSSAKDATDYLNSL